MQTIYEWSELPMGAKDENQAAFASEFGKIGDGKLLRAKLVKKAKAIRTGREEQESLTLDYQLGLVKNIALSYGKDLANRSRKMFGIKYDRSSAMSALRSYFAVDNAYILRKLRLLYCPFDHHDWSLGAHLSLAGVHAQPCTNLNALDLYIPCMGFITFIFIANWLQLSAYASASSGHVSTHLHRLNVDGMIMRTLTWQFVELFGCTVFLTFNKAYGRLKWLELVALIGYKYPWIAFLQLVNWLACNSICYLTFIYMCLALGYFVTRSLGERILKEPASTVMRNNEESFMSSYSETKHTKSKPSSFKSSAQYASKITMIKSYLKWKDLAKSLHIKVNRKHSRICYYERLDYSSYQKQRKLRSIFIIVFVVLQLFDVILSLSAGSVQN